jgi:hypothetical protein
LATAAWWALRTAAFHGVVTWSPTVSPESLKSVSQRLVLEVPPLPRAQADQIANRLPSLEAIHRRGFRMAFDYTVLTKDYERWLPLA